MKLLLLIALFCWLKGAEGTVCTGMGQCITAGSSCSDSIKTMSCQTCLANSKIQVKSLTATQHGVSVDAQGGIHTGKNLHLVIEGKNGYGRVANPSVDVTLRYCGHSGFFGGGKCTWLKQPTLGFMNNLNPCSTTSGVHMSDCHMESTSGTMSMDIDFAKNPLLAPFMGLLGKNKYYELEFTIKDNGTPINCISSGAKLLA